MNDPVVKHRPHCTLLAVLFWIFWWWCRVNMVPMAPLIPPSLLPWHLEGWHLADNKSLMMTSDQPWAAKLGALSVSSGYLTLHMQINSSPLDKMTAISQTIFSYCNIYIYIAIHIICNFVNENLCIFIKLSLKFVHKGPNDNNPALV